MNKIIIIQGGQFGSEAKGAIAGYICKDEDVDVAVRTGATNAGHTVYYDTVDNSRAEPQTIPIPVKMQQLPVGWVHPTCELVLGAGALIDPQILARECAQVSQLTGKDVRKRLTIDYRAGIHLPIHQERSAVSGRHHKIGATGKGSSEAIIDKIRGRGEGYQTFGATNYSEGYRIDDTAVKLNRLHGSGAKILLEGTQGTMLDLHLGPYPFTTHKQTGPAQWMMEAGLSPALPTDIVQVVRTYPIRVAGNSGPMFSETNWPTLVRRINNKRQAVGMAPLVTEESLLLFEAELRIGGSNYNIPEWENSALEQQAWTAAEREEFQLGLSEMNAAAIRNLPPLVVEDLMNIFEMTTVTKKLRRVANMSWSALRRATLLNRPHRIALTFMNYEFPQWWWEVPPGGSEWLVPDEVQGYIDQVRKSCSGVPITHITFGPADRHVVKCY